MDIEQQNDAERDDDDTPCFTIQEKGNERGQPLLVESRGFSYTLKGKNKSSTLEMLWEKQT